MGGFHVTVRTSAFPVSGTYSSVWISLIGSLCESPPIKVEHRLLPGSACTVVIMPEEEVGILVLVKLRLEAQPGFPDLDWHCQDVQVKHSSEDPEMEVFPCNKWIRTADGHIILRNDKVCLKKEETLEVLTNHREKDLQCKQQIIKWGTFAEGSPHCIAMTSVADLGPNLSYIRKRPVTNVHYIKGLIERRTSWRSLQELETVFLFSGSENMIAKYVQAHWQEDAFFGYQCLNGCNPLCVRQIHHLPPNFSVTSEMLKSFLPEGSSLDQEMEKGRVYLLDYEVLDQLPANTVNGKQTYLSAPLCLLHYNQDEELKPIAIQLLMPHIRSTLQINIQARATLLAANGVFDKSVACGLEAIPQLFTRATQRLRYSSLCVPDDVKERGLDALPVCYYAQDALRVWDALHRFVAGWTRLYYCSDEDVQSDCELQNWIGEIFREGFLGLTHLGVPQSFQTAAEMCKFVTMVIFSCSALHSAVNFSQLDFNLCIPNTPATMSRPPSQTKGSVSEEDLLSFLPEVNSSCHVLSVLSLLSQPAIDFVPLCHYNEWYFHSGAMAKLVEDVQKELKIIAKDIADRNSQLELPYPYMSPDYIENSVTI
ncbi:uncharacterized protein isoform X1 [Danio rerio]|uniref:Uncharacterized protein isoform X1 n=1 Tax=Danio rerio TaxID=7955 RepID=A0AC58IA63_DANRE